MSSLPCLDRLARRQKRTITGTSFTEWLRSKPALLAETRRIIERQMAMSGDTLAALRRGGLADDRETQIDFFFDAPSEAAARALADHLRRNDCLSVDCKRSGGLFSRKWTVTGRTHPTPITTPVLAEWIPWIVVQGVLHDCELDGWGAEA